MRVKPERELSYKDNHAPITTWVPIEDMIMLQQLANRNKVTLAAYLRAIIVDIIQEELESPENDCII
jgi:hypothetical protein